MSTSDIVWFGVVHVLAVVGAVLSCVQALRWLGQKEKTAILDLMRQREPILARSAFDGDVEVSRVDHVVTVKVDLQGAPKFEDEDRETMDLVVTEWNARRLLVALASALDLTLTRSARRKIRTNTR